MTPRHLIIDQDAVNKICTALHIAAQKAFTTFSDLREMDYPESANQCHQLSQYFTSLAAKIQNGVFDAPEPPPPPPPTTPQS